MSCIDGRIRDLEMRLQRAERERKQYWPITPIGGAAPVYVMWIVQGANILVSPPTTGILYAATNIVAAALPVPVIVPTPAPGAIIQVDASTPPTGMPAGIGTVKAFGSTKYAFALNDNRITGFSKDLRTGDKVYGVDSVVLAKVSGGVTYNYTCILLEATV